jgi:hypothetical protein
VNEILSPILVKLKDKNTGKLLKNPVHLDRWKIAFVCAPNPTNYFIQELAPIMQCVAVIIQLSITRTRW